MKTLNFAFIGAGSITFTLSLISDILHDCEYIETGEIRLVDIDPVALAKTHTAVSKMIDAAGKRFKVTSHSDYRNVLPGLDYIFFTFVTGGFGSWKSDIGICMRYGVPQSVGDTIGPGGIIRTIRNVPVVHQIAKDMEKICPNAWAINYSNPEGAICLALEKHSNIRTFGLCHGTPDTVRKLASKVLNVDAASVSYIAAGVNHLTWITELKVDGNDVYPKLKDKIIAAGYDKEQPVSFELFDRFGLYPAPGDLHVGEFFPFYLKNEVIDSNEYKLKNNDFVSIEQWRQKAENKLADVESGLTGYKDYGTSGETATNFIRAMSSNHIAIEMANVMNRGYIDNVTDGVIVEIPCFIDSFGLHPQKIGCLPEAIAAKCDALGREYNLAVDAAIYCDRKLALQAMMLDPLAANCAYPDKLLDELLESYRTVLSKAWFS